MQKKAALELSANVIVVIITSVIIVTLGLYILFSLLGKAESQVNQVLEQTRTALEEAANTDQEFVIISSNQDGKPGKTYYFGVGIINRVAHNTKFSIYVNLSKVVDKNNNDITLNANVNDIEEKIINKEKNFGELSKEQAKDTYIGITIPKGSPSGTYVFNVYLCTNSTTPIYSNEGLCKNFEKKRAVKSILLTI